MTPRAGTLPCALVAVIAGTAGCGGEPTVDTSASEPSLSVSSADPSMKNLTVTEVCTRASELWPTTASLELDDLRSVKDALFAISTEPSNFHEALVLIHLQGGLDDAVAYSVSDSRRAMRRALDRGYAEFERACEQAGADLGEPA